MDETVIIKEAKRIGIASETKIRNFNIRKRFRMMRKIQIPYEKAVEKLSKEFCLSESSIGKIIIENNAG